MASGEHGSQPRCPWRIADWVSSLLWAHKPLGNNQAQISLKSFKAWGMRELYATEDNGPTRELEKPILLPKVILARVWHSNDSPFPDETLSQVLIPFPLISWVVLKGSQLSHLCRSGQVGSLVHAQYLLTWTKVPWVWLNLVTFPGGSLIFLEEVHKNIGKEFCSYLDQPGLRLNPILTLSQLTNIHWIYILIPTMLGWAPTILGWIKANKHRITHKNKAPSKLSFKQSSISRFDEYWFCSTPYFKILSEGKGCVLKDALT